jgi:tetratricopeptide (TPR) repeat protein
MSTRARAEDPEPSADKPNKGPSFSKKRVLFRCLAALLVPVLFLLALEVALRLFGWAYSTHFFVRTGSGLFGENQKFGWRFFPRSLARAPDPIRLSKIKTPGTCRIFVFGESAALGDPEAAYGFSRQLRELLEARCPGTKFEIINTAMTAINSHAILPIARDCDSFQGDVWILYMGNNEVVGPFGAASVFGARAPPLWIIRAGLAVKSTALGQMLDALWRRASLSGRQPAQWEGMSMMTKEQVRESDPILQRVYDHFFRNLNDIVSVARRAGAKTLVCSISSNLKDCAPFASLNRPGFSYPLKAQWEGLVSSGADRELRKDYARAIENYGKAAQIDDTDATLAFRMARCYLALGQLARAREHYARARDLDALRFRADTQINSVIRRVCDAHAAEGLSFFDSESVVTNACRQGIPGEECFWDHVHFNFAGNYALALGLADQVIALLPDSMRRSSMRGTILTQQQCAERLAFTDWDQRSVLAEMLRRVHDPPFTAQLGHESLIQRWSDLAASLDHKLTAQELANAISIYREALARRTDDWLLHHRFALLLEACGSFADAEQHWHTVTRLVPEFAEAWFKLGETCARLGRPLEAEIYFHRLLQMRPASFEAMNSLGLLELDKGRLDAAARWFEQALRINPKFAQVHVNWGLLESSRGDAAAAAAHYREALRCDPDSVAAHINLGNLLAAQQKHAEAIEHFSQAVRLRANESTIHFALANSLSAVGRSAEAISHYQEATRLNPAMADAHFNLGVALASQGDLPGATSAFQEASRLNPQDTQARLNLGVALARQNRLPEAVAQFQAVLRLDPTNAQASQYLQSVSARAQPGP